ncbi:hypothetical protein ABPG72_011111 [Tetrahymena utriculariae]
MQNQCYSDFISKCIELTFDVLGIDSDSQKCLFDRDIVNKVNKCFEIEKNGKSSVCKNKQSTQCVIITDDINDQYIGIYKDDQANLICIEKQDIIDQMKIISPQTLVNLKFDYCLKHDFSLDDFQQRTDSIRCSCKQQYCLSNDMCIPMDSNQNAARDVNQNCAQLNQEGQIYSCFNDKGICLLKNSITQINKCTTYESLDEVIGVVFINQTNECIFKESYSKLIIDKNLVFLKSDYCLFESSNIQKVGDQDNNIVGRSQQYLCAKKDEVFSDDNNLIEICIFGYCISQHSCVEMDDFEYISKKPDNTCSSNSETDFIECFYSPEDKSTCILVDKDQKSCELMIIANPKTFGAVYNSLNNQIGICIPQDLKIPQAQLDSQKQKLTCSDGSCILQKFDEDCQNNTRRILNGKNDSGDNVQRKLECKRTYFVQCTALTYSGDTSIQDDQGYCQASFPQKICRKSKQCLKDGICVDMSQDTSQPNFAKELITTSCLPYYTVQQKAQKIKSCPTGFCILQIKSNQRYCLQIGTYIQDTQYVGIESLSQRCLSQFQISTIGIDQCGDPNYCIFQVPSAYQKKSYLCHFLQLESTQYPGNNVPAKNSSGKCQDLFQPSTINCADGFQCITDSGKCQPLSKNGPIARDVNQKCQPAYTDQSLYCAEGYCLLNYVCIPLSMQNPGREDKTSKCLQEGEKGVFGAKECFKRLCLTGVSNESIDQVCALIDYKISTQVGRYNNSQKCVQEDDMNNIINNFIIEYCYKGQYCIRQDGQGIQFCTKVQNDIACSDQNGTCIFSYDYSKKCSSCSYSQCLDKSTQKCVDLGNNFCQDSEGFCFNFQSSTYSYCSVCPKYYCLHQRTQQCTYYKQMVGQYSQNICLYQFRQDQECILQDINSANKYSENLCIDKNYFCVPIAEAHKTKTCLFCPKYFYNPGDGVCYQKENNKKYPYFNLDNQYVSEDCYPQSDCSIQNQKCPEGCQKCDDLSKCTQCIDDYFLYYDKQNQNQVCIKCDTNIYNSINQDPILSKFGTQFYKCLECNIQDQDWNLNTWQKKSCAQMMVQFAGIKRYTNNYSNFLYYAIQSGPSQNLNPNQAKRQPVNLMLQNKQTSPFSCSAGCIRCESNPNKKPYCYKCIDKYYSDQNGVCQKCPLNCLKCGRAFFDQNLTPILIDDISKEALDSGRYDVSKSTFICILCNTQYSISYDFTQCVQCGLYCLECAYEFSGNLVNYRKQNFRNKVYNFLKCIKCLPGYELSSNKKDCQTKIFLQYCLDLEFSDYYSGQSLRTYLDLTSTYYRYNCLACNQNSCRYYYYYYYCVERSFALTTQNIVYNCQYYSPYYYETTINTCVNGNPASYNNGDVTCDISIQCNRQIYQCLECFKINFNNNSYQCKVCASGYIPSFFGCIPCPETCQNCYEEGYVNSKRVNFTNYIINTPQDTVQFTLQQRLSYKNIYKIKMKCTDCKLGFLLDFTQQNCQAPQCGQYCQNCIYYKDDPLCISCNYTELFNLITPIQNYISKLHYGTNFLSNFQQMVTFDSQQKNCQICPLLCETCEDNHLDIHLDPLSLYKVKCYSCKQQLPSKYAEIQKYEIRYDKARQRCIYCLKYDNGCFFKKKTEIFAICGTINDPLGKGTFEQPINLYKINELNFDQLIINDPEYDISVIYYNELQLREIDFTINFIDKSRVCNESFALNINTNIKNRIPSIQTLSITLNANQTNSQTDFLIQQHDLANLKGFSSFKIQNIQLIPKNKDTNFGFNVYDEYMNHIEFQNSTFQCQHEYLNQLQTYFGNFNGTFIMNSTIFNNCSFYQSTLINIHSDFHPTFLTYQLINLSILYSDFSQKSKFISVSSPSDIEIQDFKFMHGSLSQQSYLLASNFQGQEITSMSNVTNMLFQNSTLLSYSQILQGERQVYFYLINFTFINSTCKQNQNYKVKMSLFQVNTISAQNIIIQSNYFENTQFIQFSPALDFQDHIIISLNQINVFNNTFNSFEQLFFSQSGKFKTDVIISNFNISNNTYIQNYNIFYFQVKQINSLLLSNGKINEPQLITLIQVIGINKASVSTVVFGDKNIQSQSLNLINIQDLIQQILIKSVTFNQIIADEILFIVSQFVTNQFNPNQFQATFSTVIFNQIMLRKQASIKLNIQIFSVAQITIMQGYTKMSFIQAYNVIQPPTNIQTDSFFSTVINFKNTVGKLEIINSNIMNSQNHPNHNLLYIQAVQVQIQQSNFVIQSNNLDKLQLSGSPILGGIAMIQCSVLKIQSSLFSGGLSLQGGGLYIQTISLANIYIYQTNFTNNWSFSQGDLKNSNGGAVYINQMQQNLGVSLRFIQCLFSNNFAFSKGGALYVSQNKNKFYLNMLLSKFINNLSQDGSSLYSVQQNLESIISIQQTNDLYSYKYIQSFIQIIEQFMKSISNYPSLYHLQGFSEVYFFLNTFTAEASVQLNQNGDQNLLIFQSLMAFNQMNYLQLIQNKVSNFKVQNYLVQITNIESFSMYQDQFLNNQQVIVNANKFNADSLITIKANSIKLEQIIYQNNNCIRCAKGNLMVVSNHILVTDSSFQQNTALNGGALSLSQQVSNELITNKLRYLSFYSYYEEYLIRKSDQNQTIYNTTFSNNIALNNGGSIMTSNTFLYIIECKFQENSANQFGGAIVSDLNNKSDKIQKIHLIKNIFSSNKARIGSSFYQMQNLPLQKLLSNGLSQNKAQLYNNNLIQFAVSFLGLKNKQNYINSLLIDRHISGKFKDDIVINLVNSEDQPITTLNEEIKLNVQVLKGEDYYIDQYQITQKSGIFQLNDKIQVFGRLGKQIKLQISSEYAKLPIYNQDGELTKMETSIFFEIDIHVVQKCPVGTTYFNDTLKKDLCNPCPKFMFNLNDGDKCHKCPDNFECNSTSVYLPRGLWRSQNNSYNFIECFGYFQCVGDIDRREIINQYSDQNRYCQEGNIGALCMDCDLYGNYWNERYYQIARYTCSKCGQFNAKLMVDILVFLINIILFAYIAKSIFMLMDYLKIQKVFKILKIYFKYDQRFFVISNILLNYFAQMSLCANNMIYLPVYLKQILQGFGNPSEIILKLFDCLFSQISWFSDNQSFYFYFRNVIQLIFNFLICLITLICFRILKNKDFYTHISVMIYFSIHFFTHSINSALKMIYLLSCFIFCSFLVKLVQAENCSDTECFSEDVNECITITSDIIGIDSQNQKCLQDRDVANKVDRCFDKQINGMSTVCKNSSNTMCVIISNNIDDNYIGIYNNETGELICIEKQDVEKLLLASPLILINLKSQYCIKDDYSLEKFSQRANSMRCSCKQQFCLSSDSCIPMDKNDHAAKDVNQSCKAINEEGQIQNCYLDNSICMVKDPISQSSKCVSQENTEQAIGIALVNGKNECILQQSFQNFQIDENLVFLKKDYCLYQSSQVIQIKDQDKQVVGRTQQFMCVSENQVYSDKQNLVEMCISGFCIANNTCVQMDDFQYISKMQDDTCSGNSSTDFKECFYSREANSTCILKEDGQASCEILTIQNSKTSGAIVKQSNNQIAQSDKKLTCAEGLCILRQKIFYNSEYYYFTVECTTMTFSNETTAEDDEGYCLPVSSGKKCKKTTQCLMEKNCVDMTYDTNLPNFAKEQGTTACLPYKTIEEKGQHIKNCPFGFCIIQLKTNQRYCIQLGSFIQDLQYIGVENQTQRCLISYQISTIGIDQCGDINYCIYQVPSKSKQKQYLCHPLQLESTQFKGVQVPAKNINGYCQKLQQDQTISCIDGFYCISNFGQCVPLDSQQNIARRSNQLCQSAYTDQSIYCAMGYCQLNQRCIPLSFEYPGRENKTSKCLLENEKGIFGAGSCQRIFCLSGRSDEEKEQSCVQIDYKISSQVGRYMISQKCVKKDDYSNQDTKVEIEYCFKGQYCIKKDEKGVQTCTKVQNDIRCSDENGQCIQTAESNRKCKNCPFSKCLQYDTCIDLQEQYCQDETGSCQPIYSYSCSVCPQKYCLNQWMKRCIYYLNIPNNYSNANCLYQPRQDQQCFLQEINSFNKYQEILCINKNNFCISLTDAKQNKQCVFCPKYFYNPGDGFCYQRKIDNQYPFFNLDIQYASEDCFPNSDCSNNSQKCPEGCQKCEGPNFCTQCIDEYFLYLDKETKYQLCVKCDTQYYNNLNQDPLLKQYGTESFKCIECNLQEQDWQLKKQQNKNCAKMVVKFVGNLKYTNSYSNLLYYIVQNGNTSDISENQAKRLTVNNAVIQKQTSPFSCESTCIRCESDPKKPLFCYKCADKYYSNQYEDILKETLDEGKYDVSNAIVACVQCVAQYTISPDFGQCIQCGFSCLECAFEIEGNLLNYRKQNFKQFQFQFLKCIKCQYGYQLSANKKDCTIPQILKLCYDSVLYDQESGLSIRTYLDVISNSYQYKCLKCQERYCLYKNTCIHKSQFWFDRYTIFNCENSNDYYEFSHIIYCQNGIPAVISPTSECDPQDKCKNQVYQCEECYTDLNIYQCKQCKNGSQIPSIFGCLPCQQGCNSCYEEGYIDNKRINFTDYLINNPQDVLKFKLYQRLNYKSVFSIKMKCMECYYGYIIDFTQQYCLTPQCGKYCSNQPIQSFISKLHFGTNYLNSFQQMVTFDSQQKNCQICPLLCETCEDNQTDLVSDPLSIYKVSCYSCKQQLLSSQPEMQKYEIRYDKVRKRCIYCLKEDNGCYFKKKTEIFAICGSINDPYGKGTIEEPYNLHKIKATDFDQLIINESEFDMALVYYNELQLRYINFTINFIDQSRNCIEKNALNFTTKLKERIPSIQNISMTLNAFQEGQQQDYTFYQQNIANFRGFSFFKIQNFNLIPKNQDNKFGLNVEDEYLNYVEFQNVKFTCQRQYQNQLQLDFQNFNGTFIMSNMHFSNCSFQQQTLINVFSSFMPTYLTYNLMNVSISQSDFFQKSKFISISSPSIMEIYKFKFKHGVLENQSQIFSNNFQGDDLTSTLNITCLHFKNTTLLSQSQILLGERYNYFYLQDFMFINSTCKLNLNKKVKTSLFSINTILANNVTIQSNTFEKTHIIQFSPIADFIDQASIYLNQFLVFNNTFSNDEQIFFYQNGRFKTNVNLTNFNISQNTYSQSYNLYFFKFLWINSLFLNNGIVDEKQLITFIQVTSVSRVSVLSLNFGNKLIQSYSPNLINIQEIIQYISVKNITFNYIIADEILLIISQLATNNFDPQAFKAVFNIITFNEIVLRKQASVKLNIHIFSAAQITLAQGIAKLNLIQALNVCQPTIESQQENFLSSVINFKNPLGKLEIVNSYLINSENHSNHNLFNIQATSVQISSSKFVIKSSNFGKLQLAGSPILGGLAQIQSRELKIQNSFFSGGLSLQGGGIYWQALEMASIQISQTNFTENWSFSQKDAKNSNGGAIYINQVQYNQGATIQFIQCIFKNNLAYFKGGAIFVSPNLRKFYLNLQYSSFINNFSSEGSNFYSSQQINQNIIQIQQTQTLFQYDYIQKLTSQIEEIILPVYNSPSLFYLKGFYQVYLIQNSYTAEITPNINKFDDKIQLIFQGLLFFDSIKVLSLIQNNINSFTSYKSLIYISYVDSFEMFLDTIKDNQQFIINKPSFEIDTLVYVSADSIKINQLTYQNNTCITCLKGNLRTVSNHILIIDSILKLNTAYNGGALSISQQFQTIVQTNNLRFLPINFNQEYIIRKSQQNQTIYNTKFINNSALNNGGSIIVFDSTFYLIQCLFQQNNATEYGGAIVSDLNFKSDQIQKIHLIQNTFQKNLAKIGSSFYQIQNLPIYQQYNNQLKENIAQLYNNNLIQFAVSFIGIKNSKSFKKQMTIDKHISGQFQDEIILQLVNSEDQPITILNKEITLNIKAQGEDYYISQESISQKSGIFNFTKKIQVFGRLGKTIKLHIQSEYTKYPVYGLDGEITKIETNIFFEIIINIVQKCPQGTQLFSDNQKKDKCNSCPLFMFNLNDGDKCYKCPQDFVCDNKNIFLPIGVWRSQNNSYNFIGCYGYFQCVGDIDRQQSLEYYSDENRYCAEGNIGALCMDCDLFGNYWNERYYQSSIYTCSKCGEFNASIIIDSIILLINIVLFIYLAKQIFLLMDYLKIKKVFQILKITFTFDERFFVIANILLNYIAQLSVCVNNMIYLPVQFKQIFKGLGNPSEIILKLFDCIFSQISLFKDNNIFYFYFRIVIILILNFLICIIAMICFKIFKKQEILVYFSVLIYFTIHLYIHSIDSTLKMIFCDLVEDKFYVNQFPKIECDDYHAFLVNVMLIPCLGFQIIFIIFVVLLLCKENLILSKKKQITSIFSYFYKRFWWFFFFLGMKLLVIVVDNFFYLYIQLKGSILCALYLSYTLTQLYFYPYKRLVLTAQKVICNNIMEISQTKNNQQNKIRLILK